MELTGRDFRALVYYFFKKGMTAEEAKNELDSTFSTSVPHRATIFRWFSEFREGKAKLSKISPPGRPISQMSDENIRAVKSMVTENPRLTYEEIEQSLAISSTTVYKILHDCLHLKKVSARFVPHLLTEDQQQARVTFCHSMLQKFDEGRSKAVYSVLTGDETWLHCYDPETKQQSMCWVGAGDAPPLKLKRSRSVTKVMVAVFFGALGHIATIPVLEQKTVTAKWYVEKCLPEVLKKWSSAHPKTGTRGLLLHHDNASSHTAGLTLDFLKQKNINLLPHPPYSPDLAPADFFLFPYTKNLLRGRRFQTDEELRYAFQSVIEDIPQEMWRDCFTNWFRRMRSCIAASGRYFEKL